MAQTVFQMSGMRYDPEHANVQGLQQTTILRSVSFHISKSQLYIHILSFITLITNRLYIVVKINSTLMLILRYPDEH